MRPTLRDCPLRRGFSIPAWLLAGLLWSAILLGAPPPASAVRIQVATLCDRSRPSDWGVSPSVDVLYYQGPCNPKLVPGKPAAVRVYLDWRKHEGLKSVPDYDVTVTLASGSGSAIACTSSPAFPAKVLRPDQYRDSDRETAANSVNFFGCDLDGVEEITASVFIEGRDEAVTQTRKVAHMRQAQEIRALVVFPTVGGWSRGVPADAVHAGIALLEKGRAFALQNLPVGDVKLKVPADPTLSLIEPQIAAFCPDCTSVMEEDPDLDDFEMEEEWVVDSAPCESYPAETCRTFVEKDLIDDDELRPEEWLFDRLEGRSGAHLVIALVPPSFQGGWRGDTMRPLYPWQKADANSLELMPRKPAVMIIRSDADPSTVAHELGHYLGLPHHEGTLVRGKTREVEGFLLTRRGGVNKSYVEGNGDPKASGRLFSLMADGRTDDGVVLDFIMNTQYHVLVDDMEEDPLPGASTPPSASGLFREPLPRRSGPSVAESSGGARRRPGTTLLLRGSRSEGPTILVSGRVAGDGRSARLRPLEWVPIEAGASGVDGDAEIRFLDASGSVVGSVPVDLEATPTDAIDAEDVGAAFRVVTNLPPTATALRVVSGGTVLVEQRASPSTPEVRILAPDGSGAWAAGSPIRWEGRDDDGSTLRYSVYYTSDGGRTWVPLAIGVGYGQLRGRTLTPGPDPRMVVTVSDGFRVAADTVSFRPTVDVAPLAFIPAQGDTVLPDATLRVVLNSDLPDRGTWQDALELVDPSGRVVEGTVKYERDARALEFEPDEGLRPGAEYRGRIPAGLEDRYGNRSPDEVAWRFRVAADTTRPRVERTTPGDGAMAVPVDGPLSIRFSEPMDEASLRRFRLIGPGGEEVEVSMAWDGPGRTVEVRPRRGLSPRTRYEATVPADVADPSGNTVSEEFNWAFVTSPLVPPARRFPPPAGEAPLP